MVPIDQAVACVGHSHRDSPNRSAAPASAAGAGGSLRHGQARTAAGEPQRAVETAVRYLQAGSRYEERYAKALDLTNRSRSLEPARGPIPLRSGSDRVPLPPRSKGRRSPGRATLQNLDENERPIWSNTNAPSGRKRTSSAA